jgi:tight adherence protein C
MLMLLTAILVFSAVTALVIAFVAESRQVRVADRIETVRGHAGRTASGPLAQELQKSLWQRVFEPQVGRLRGRVLDVTPEGLLATTRLKLEAAGSAASMNAATFIVVRIVVAAVSVLIGLWMGAMIHGTPLMRMGAIGIIILVGVLGPEAMLDGRAKARQKLIRKNLPDIIDLLVVSTEAGTGLDGALQVVVARKRGPLPDEFSRVLTEVQLGKARQEAWADMAERVGLPELKMLVAALRQAEQLGVSIAKTLRAQADGLRTRRSMAIRQIAATLSVKMLFPMVFCILPALFAVVMGPGLISLSGAFTTLGWR